MFAVLKVDASGYRHSVETHRTREGAEARIKEFQQSWPGTYILRDQAAGEMIKTRSQTSQASSTGTPHDNVA